MRLRKNNGITAISAWFSAPPPSRPPFPVPSPATPVTRPDDGMGCLARKCAPVGTSSRTNDARHPPLPGLAGKRLCDHAMKTRRSFYPVLKTRGADDPPVKLPESVKQRETPIISVISQPSCRLGRCGILPRSGGWKAEGWLTQSPPRMREGNERKELARRGGGLGGGGCCTKGQKGNERGGWSAGGMSALKSMKTASRTLKGGRDAGGRGKVFTIGGTIGIVPFPAFG